MDIKVDEAVERFMEIRTERERITREFELADGELKALQETLKSQLLAVCNELGVDSVKTQYGTVMRQLKERYYTQDWEGFYNFVVENKCPHLLERRIAQKNMSEWIRESKEQDGLPPGVSSLREYEISIRKAS